MNNVCRSDYVECMAASVPGADWRLTWADGRDWAPRDGGPWIEAPGRLAHLYVFAWHGRHDEHADHRNAEQWQLLVTGENDLPSGQKSIGLARLEEIATRCGIAELRQVIEMFRKQIHHARHES